MRPVRAYGDRVKLEGEVLRVEFCVEVASFLRPLYRTSDRANPFVHDLRNAVAHDAQPPIEFKRSGSKKASALENSFFNEDQPMINQRPKPGHALGGGYSRARHLIDENLARHFNGS